MPGEVLSTFVRSWIGIVPERTRRMRGTGIGSLAVGQVESSRHAQGAARRRYGGSLVNVAAVNGLGTTYTQIGAWLWNGEDQGTGKSYAIDAVGLAGWTAAATFNSLAILLAVTTSPIAQPANGGLGAITSLSDGATSSKAVLALSTGAGAMPNVGAFAPFYSRVTIGAGITTPGAGRRSVEIGGALVVPPQCALAVLICSQAGNATHVLGLQWSELWLDLE